ncbi:hypothetical protein K449DRAFT_386883 [Hypoxylon sp. EC38]|nr:hypothetical protein K449DRAFT_386883 [Hypoxylon sp. EC38]
MSRSVQSMSRGPGSNNMQRHCTNGSHTTPSKSGFFSRVTSLHLPTHLNPSPEK